METMKYLKKMNTLTMINYRNMSRRLAEDYLEKKKERKEKEKVPVPKTMSRQRPVRLTTYYTNNISTGKFKTYFIHTRHHTLLQHVNPDPKQQHEPPSDPSG